jgi:hypothetical protein
VPDLCLVVLLVTPINGGVDCAMQCSKRKRPHQESTTIVG